MQTPTSARVFVVEDEAVIAMDLRERLSALGYQVCGGATQGETAVEAIVAARPDIVLMDVHLSGAMDGVEAARRLRGRHDAPVVFLTAYADADMIDRASQTSAYGYLVKPFEERELHATLQVALARARANAELDGRIAERTKELREALADMESFSYCIAHDLRAPLRSMSGYATLIATMHGAGLDSPALQMLRNIELAAGRMSSLIDGLLEFARLGRQAIGQHPVAMRRLAQEAAKELRAQAGERRLDIRIGEMPDAVGETRLMDLVWRNLLSNASKFSAGRDLALIEAGFDAAVGAWFVRDNGAGFDMKYADKLFRPFSRLHGSDEFEGVGIGLAHVARIVQRHGGRVWVDAALGKGATFYFEVPRWQA